MSFTSFSGPVRAGTVKDNPGRNMGLVVLSQEYDSGDLTGATVGNVDAAVMVLPSGARITDIVVDQGTASTTGTTTLSVGSTSGGAELMAAVATTAGGRFRGTATAATQAAWKLSTSADTTVYLRNATGTATLGAGRFVLTVLYVQRSPTGLANPATS